MHIRRLALLLGVTAFVLSVAPDAVAAQAHVVLDGYPKAFAYADGDTVGRSVLPQAEREGSRVTLVERDGAFFWATRENRQMVHVPSNLFHYFIDPRGGGYIKVLDQTGLPADSPLRFAGPDVQFFEHVSGGMSTYTYFGWASHWSPPR